MESFVHTISDNDLFHRLAFDNPWWEFTDTTQVKFLNPVRRSFFPAFSECVKEAGQGNTLVLAGPLRAGKTVMVRQMVAHLVEQGVSPQNIFLCSMVTPSYTATDIGTLFEMFCRRFRHKPDAELYVFFDEIQYIKDWEKAILKLALQRLNVRLIATVSAGAPSLISGTVTHEGRLKTFILPPLTFLEFLRYRNTETELFNLIERKTERSDSGSVSQRVNVALKKGALPYLNEEFHRYVNFGGFLEGVLGKQRKGSPAPTFIRDGVTDRVLHKDLAAMYGVNDTQELNRLFALLAFNTGRDLSYDDLAKAASIAKNTLRKYLDYLESAFLIRRVARVDRDAKLFQRAVAFKVYLTTPCLYTALFGPTGMTDQHFRRLAETALVSQWLGSPAIKDLAYASWRGGSIDLMSLDPETGKPGHIYELDWKDGYNSPANRPDGLVDFVERNNREAKPYILSQTIARPGMMRNVDLTLAPIALYCYWLDRDPTLKSMDTKKDNE